MAAQNRVVAIHRAALHGDAGVVAGMLDDDPELLSSIWRNDALLTRAAGGGHVGVVRLLLDRGADVNTSDAFGATALHIAAARGHEEVVSMLLGSDAEISRRSNGGCTALMYASECGRIAAVRVLLRSMGGRALNERNQHGHTALYIACRWGYVDILRALLLAGADHTIANNDGTTPQQIAQQGRHHQCVRSMKWWEDELQRAYALHKARRLHEGTATRQQAPAAPVPAYLSPRVQGGKRLPQVQVRGRGGSGGPRTRGAARRGAEEGGQENTNEEEVCAMVGFVVKDLAAELYTELPAGLH